MVPENKTKNKNFAWLLLWREVICILKIINERFKACVCMIDLLESYMIYKAGLHVFVWFYTDILCSIKYVFGNTVCIIEVYLLDDESLWKPVEGYVGF